MGLYALHDLLLEVQPDELEFRAQLTPVLSKLSLLRLDRMMENPLHHLAIRLYDKRMTVPLSAIQRFHADGFTLFECDGTFYLQYADSVFQIPSDSQEAHAWLDPAFFAAPLERRSEFWSFGLLKMIRPLGYFTLHGAGLIAPDGDGVLVIGPSGSGKSTLALGLIRHGWRYLSDDGLLLHSFNDQVQALALRKHFYVDSSTISKNNDLPLDEEIADRTGGHKRRVCFEKTLFGRQHSSCCVPRTLIRTRIVHEAHSSLVPLSQAVVVKELLEGSGPQLFDRTTMPQQFQILNDLAGQSRCFELRAGGDILDDASVITRLLIEANAKEATWPALLSN